MASLLSRWIFGLTFFAVGVFWSIVSLVLFSWNAIRKGKRGFTGIFERTSRTRILVDEDKTFEHDYLRTESGMRFHCVHAGDRSSPLMLCLHGFPECWYSFHHILTHFSKSYHVVAFDMRGYGESDKPQSINEYHLTYLARDVKELIEALGYEKAIIIGHDWGGAATWIVPKYFPQVVDKLIILNSAHNLGFQEFMTKNPSQLLKSWYMFMYQLPYLPEFLVSAYDFKSIALMLNGRTVGIRNKRNKLTDQELNIYKYCAGENIKYAINYYRAVNPIYTGLKLQSKGKIIKQPVLLIWGKKDSALDYRCIPYFEKYVENFTVRFIDEASHWVSLDEPEQVIGAMEQFLNK